MGESVGIVVPAYRPDPDRVARYVRSLREAFPDVAIRIELDAPDSGVPERLAALPATVATADRKRGKGAAVTAGFEALDADVLAFVDADGATAAADVAAVVDAVRDRRAALSVGSRRHPESVVERSQSRVRRALGGCFAWLARRWSTVPLYDYQCGAKAITADGWQTVRTDLYEAGFGWDVELVTMAGARGLEITEVPITWTDVPGSTVDATATAGELARALVRSGIRARRTDRRPIAVERQSLVERVA